MSDFEQRCYIKCRTSLHENARAIHDDLKTIYGSSSYSYSTVAKWVNLFKSGRESLEDDSRCGRPRTEVIPYNIKQIEELIADDPHITYCEMEDLSGLSRGTIERIIIEHLQLRKITSRWVPHQLTPMNKLKRLNFAKEMLNKFDKGEWRLDQIVTGDESWFYYRQLGKKTANASWKKKGEHPDIVVRRQIFEPKRLYSIFFKSTGPLSVHYVEEGMTIDHSYYIENLLSPMIESLIDQRPKSGTHGMKILHDNARPHIHQTVVNFLKTNGFQIIDHPPYSPDLSPCDYWLFDYIKQHLDDHNNDKTLCKSITKIFEEIPKSEYRKTFEKYKH